MSHRVRERPTPGSQVRRTSFPARSSARFFAPAAAPPKNPSETDLIDTRPVLLILITARTRINQIRFARSFLPVTFCCWMSARLCDGWEALRGSCIFDKKGAI